MTAFTIIGLSVCVILGTLFVGSIIACIMTLGEKYCDDLFYVYMFFGSWVTSTAFLILCLISSLQGK